MLLRTAQPVLRDAELARLRGLEDRGFPLRTIDITWPRSAGAAGMEAALAQICAAAEEAIAAGAAVLVLSDRAAGPERIPIPSLLALAGVHHHLIRAGKRMGAELVVESAEPREVHHVAALIGYGAAAVNPYLALATVAELAERGHLAEEIAPEEAERRLVKAFDKGLIALQHRVEGAGAKFNLIAGPRPLAGLVNAADELVVVGEGLLPAAPEAKAALENGPGVLVLPVEAGVAAGFERIDLNHAWAGVLAMPGRLVERLNQLPPDCDATSALLRIALQGRVPLRNLPEAVLSERRWALLASRAQLAEFEPEWFRRHVAPPPPFAPGRAAARLAMRGAGAKLLAKGWKPGMMAAGGALVAALGVGAAWFGLPVLGMAACGLGWLALEAGRVLTAFAAAGSAGETKPDRTIPAAGVAIDVLLVAVLALALSGGWMERLYPPLVLLGAARVAGGLIPAKWAELAEDRAVLALLLAAATLGHALLPAIQLLSLSLIGAILGVARITRA